MLQIIVFSYNRAILLDSFLKSLKTSLNNSEDAQIHVIYNYSDGRFKEGYEFVSKKYDCSFIREGQASGGVDILRYILYPRNIYRLLRHNYYRKAATDFRYLLMFLLQRQTEFGNVVFFTDDSLLYRNISIGEEILNWVNDAPEANSFHLRFGANYLVKPTNIECSRHICTWRLDDNSDPDWSYRFSVDGQIFNASFLMNVFKRLNFFNPTTLESNTNFFCSRKNFLRNGKCFKDSALVGFELNRVQSTSPNNNLGVDNSKLNSFYLQGYELKYVFDVGNVRSFRPTLCDVCLEKSDSRISVFKGFQVIVEK